MTLGRWQFLSFLSRGVALLIGLVQSFVIIRVLSLSEWGIVQLAVSIGGALGIYQHLGLASASTREIAAQKRDSDIYKIFITSIVVRYVVTTPLGFGLIFFADHIANSIYNNSALILPLQIYGATMFIQGFQSILNAIITGTKRFKNLLAYQMIAALMSIVLYIPLVIQYKVSGYFYAYFLFNLLNTVFLFFIAFKPLKEPFVFPSRGDFVYMFKQLFSISLALYFVKILSTNWEKLPANLLGLSENLELVALFSFATLYSKKILSISDAVTDINLPVLSEKFVGNFQDFRNSFTNNFDKVYTIMIVCASFAAYWGPQIINLLVGNKYISSYKYIPLILAGFIIYGVLDIVKSSVYVPAKMTFEMTLTYLFLLGATFGVFKAAQPYTDLLMSMAIALFGGVLVSQVYSIYAIFKKLGFWYFQFSHNILLIELLIISYIGITGALIEKLALFPLVLLTLLLTIIRTKFVSVSEMNLLRLWKRKK